MYTADRIRHRAMLNKIVSMADFSAEMRLFIPAKARADTTNKSRMLKGFIKNTRNKKMILSE
tara:strand:+ start:433 stop:618 length:186 start_codon:yes stop_codon:yes gene_type:complete